jgi:Raf kinase inhibitor-like YbhB/YbcL family protein
MGSGVFTLTSPAFVGLADPDASIPKDAAPTIPPVDTCADPNVAPGRPGESPELDWSGAPAGTMSYVVTLVDLTINGYNYHWSVWDLPASITSLPMGVPKGPVGEAGAMQVSFQNGVTHNEYVGPCPAGNLHEYQFSVFALNTPTLPGLTAMPTSKEVYTQALKVAIGRATYTGLSNAK